MSYSITWPSVQLDRVVILWYQCKYSPTFNLWYMNSVTRHFLKGDFVCEYASTVLSKDESLVDESRYQEAGLGCYCLDAMYQGKWYTFDATLTL